MEEKDIWLNKKNGWAFLIVIALCLLIGLLKDVMGKPKPTKKILEIKVRKGWCLSKIANGLGTSTEDLATMNNIQDPNLIRIGQILKVIPYNKNNIIKVSWYGKEFHGKKTSSGKIFDMNNPKMAAHKLLPFGTKVRLTRTDTKETITMVIWDRGPYIKGRHFDLSAAGAQKLGITEMGHTKCKVEILN